MAAIGLLQGCGSEKSSSDSKLFDVPCAAPAGIAAQMFCGTGFNRFLMAGEYFKNFSELGIPGSDGIGPYWANIPGKGSGCLAFGSYVNVLPGSTLTAKFTFDAGFEDIRDSTSLFTYDITSHRGQKIMASRQFHAGAVPNQGEKVRTVQRGYQNCAPGGFSGGWAPTAPVCNWVVQNVDQNYYGALLSENRSIQLFLEKAVASDTSEQVEARICALHPKARINLQQIELTERL